MKRIVILLACVLLLAGCCHKKAVKSDQDSAAGYSYPGVQCYLYHDANMIALTLADSLVPIALELLAKSDDILRLAVEPEMIDGIKTKGTALEIVFPEEIKVDSALGTTSVISKLLIPLDGGFGAGPELSTATLFLGRKEWLNGPNVNHKARPYLIRLRELLELE